MKQGLLLVSGHVPSQIQYQNGLSYSYIFTLGATRADPLAANWPQVQFCIACLMWSNKQRKKTLAQKVCYCTSGKVEFLDPLLLVLLNLSASYSVQYNSIQHDKKQYRRWYHLMKTFIFYTSPGGNKRKRQPKPNDA